MGQILQTYAAPRRFFSDQLTTQEDTGTPGVRGLKVLSAGQEVAYLTYGAKTATLQAGTRTFTEAKKVGAQYKEDFGRTRTSGWGLSPFYGSWSNNAGGVLADYTVDGTVGKILPTSTNVSHYQTLRDDVANADVRIKARVTTTPSGAANSISILTAYASTSAHNRARVTFNTTGALTATIGVVSGGSETAVATQSNVITGYTAGQWVWIRMQRTGSTLNMWLWADGQSEPVTPTVTATSTVNTVGRVGIRAFNSTGAVNSPTYEIDELQITAGTWPTPPSVTHSTWVRVLPQPFTGWSSAIETQIRRWLVDTRPDLLSYAMAYIAGAPAAIDTRLTNVGANAPKQVIGEARYGPTEADGKRQEGSDFNDYIRISWAYPALAVPSTDINELVQQYCLDCSGYMRMLFGYHMGVPVSLDDVADLNGLNLPRRSVLIGPSGPGVLIAESVGTAVDNSNIRIGDMIAFNADAADDNAGEEAGDVEENDDHVGLFIGLDGSGNKIFISARKTANGPSFGPVGGVSYLNGTGFWAVSARHLRRI